MAKLIGRQKEIDLLNRLYKSDKSEFVALYGRRRVGKTFLIKELFGDRYDFHVTGLSNVGMERQLSNFFIALNRFDKTLEKEEIPNNWFDAFQLLIKVLERKKQKRKVVFIDELPWLDTARSEFIPALEHFWNSWAFHQDNIFLVVCGSATSWIINHLINNRGGLHNRVTIRIHLYPFTLKETEQYLKSKGGTYDYHQILQLYMAVGGIPFYLERLNPRQSVAQNIDELFFTESGLLRTEFGNLYSSLFKTHERHVAIIRALAEKGKGLTRKEIAKVTKLTPGGTLTRILEELEQCGFIKQYLPFGKKNRGSLYQLIDFYSLFYLKFIEGSKAFGSGAWLAQIDHPKWRAWSGYAFENICFYHTDQIKKGLGIGAVYTEISSWKSNNSAPGAQVDLVIDRRDRVIHLCEIKFSENEFTITKAYAENLQHKIKAFKKETKTNKSIFLTFITLYGLKQNQYSINLVQNQLRVDKLFFD